MNKLATATAAIGLAVLVGACGGIDIDDDDLEPIGETVVPADEVVDEQQSGIEDRRRRVIRSRAAWRAFWDEVYEGRRPRPSPPEIDFDDFVVIAVATGERRTGGYDIEIDEVYRTPTGLAAVVIETEPAEDCLVTQATTAPVHAVRVRLTEEPVEFVERRRIREC